MHHRHHEDLHHYDSELHRQESMIAHLSKDPMIRDALNRKTDLGSYLGHGLQPKVGGSKKPDTFYAPNVKRSMHLEPQHHLRRYHEMDPRLSHAHDDQHDIEPVHYHERSIH